MEKPTKSLAQWRTERKMSQRELARRADVHLNTVWKTETHQSTPTYEVADKLSRTLDVDPREVAEFRPVVERVGCAWQQATQQQSGTGESTGGGTTGLASRRLVDLLANPGLLRSGRVDYGDVREPDSDREFAEKEDLTGLVEAEAGNATGVDPMEEDVMENPELVRIGLRGSLRALMRHLGREETDQAYRRVFGSDPKDEE